MSYAFVANESISEKIQKFDVRTTICVFIINLLHSPVIPAFKVESHAT